jgi:hypothetical protein
MPLQISPRKNAKNTSVVAIGEKTHQVLKCEHVTKTDDLVTQRHEKIGTERMYSYMNERLPFVAQSSR